MSAGGFLRGLFATGYPPIVKVAVLERMWVGPNRHVAPPSKIAPKPASQPAIGPTAVSHPLGRTMYTERLKICGIGGSLSW